MREHPGIGGCRHLGTPSDLPTQPPLAVPLLRAPVICELSIKFLPSSDRPRVLSPAWAGRVGGGVGGGVGGSGSLEALRPRPEAVGRAGDPVWHPSWFWGEEFAPYPGLPSAVQGGRPGEGGSEQVPGGSGSPLGEKGGAGTAQAQLPAGPKARAKKAGRSWAVTVAGPPGGPGARRPPPACFLTWEVGTRPCHSPESLWTPQRGPRGISRRCRARARGRCPAVDAGCDAVMGAEAGA